MPIAIQDNTRIDGHLCGVYLQDEWRATKALTVNYGLRYDQVNTVVDESQVSPRVGLVYDVSRDLRAARRLRALLHAAADREDRHHVDREVRGHDQRAAVGRQHRGQVRALALLRRRRGVPAHAAGHARHRRLLPQGAAPAGRRPVRQRADLLGVQLRYGEIGGVDLTASYRDKALSGYVNVGFSARAGKGVETGQFNFDPDELDYIAQNWVHLDHEQAMSASGGVAYRWADGWLTSADALYGSGLRRGFANTEHLPSYTVFNAAVARTFQLAAGVGAIDLRLAVQNIFDRVYQLRDGSGIGVGAPQYGLRRAFYVTAGKTF